LTDRELIEQLQRGSHDAFDAIFRTHYARMVGAAEALLGERAAAEEAAQEVMLELWRRRASITIETALAAYLFRSVRNRALNQIRHARTRLSAEPQLAAEAGTVTPTDARVREQELRAAFADALEELPPRCREVFELSRGQGMRYSEIADALGISVKTVEAQMGKALRIIRDRLAEWLPAADL
jgi:RNA polymerase sigma-70 factor (ECF subfamily)